MGFRKALTVASEVVLTACSSGSPFGAEDCPTSADSIGAFVRSVDFTDRSYGTRNRHRSRRHLRATIIRQSASAFTPPHFAAHGSSLSSGMCRVFDSATMRAGL